MTFLAGENITAGRLNRLQPTTYHANGSGTVAASQTNADVPGCTVTFTTAAANAVVDIWWFVQFDLAGPTTTVNTSRINIDAGAQTSPIVAAMAAEVSTDAVTTGQSWKATLAAAGSHTIKVQATTPANGGVGTNNSLKVMVTEVV